jgi:WD40 repeat protein
MVLNGPALSADPSALRFPETIRAVAWNDDGSRLVASNQADNHLYLYDVADDRLVWTVTKIGPRASSSLSFDRNGKLVVTGSTINWWPDSIETTVTLLNADDGSVSRHLAASAPDREARTNLATSFALSADKTGLVVVLGQTSGMVAIYDAGSWAIARYLQLRAPGPLDVAIDPRNHLLFAGYIDGAVQIWDYDGASLLRQFRCFDTGLGAMVLNPLTGAVILGGTGAIIRRRVTPGNGPGAFATQHDNPSSLVQAWDPRSAKRIKTYVGPGLGTRGLAVSPDGAYVAATKAAGPGMGSYLLVWDAQSADLMTEIAYPRGDAAGLAFSGDGRRLAVAVGQEVHLIAIRP